MKRSWLGQVDYEQALERQRRRRQAVLAGAESEVLWLLEHPPVVTTGRREVPPEQLPAAARGLPVVATERGGLVTYHGPGQLVGYLIADLPRHAWRVRGVVRGMEAGLIEWLGTVGVQASRRQGFPGVWVGRDKIGAIGIHLRRGISMHGFALNLQVDLAPFGWFIPCGVSDGGVVSVAALRGASPAPAEVWSAVADSVLAGIARVHAR